MKINCNKLVPMVLASLLLLVSFSGAEAQVYAVNSGDFELGVLLGEPTGLSAKFWTAWNSALDFGAAWSFGKGGNFHLHADYLFHNFEFFDVASGTLPIYAGIGGRVRLEDDDSRAGIRIAVGAEYIFENYPLSLFFEVAPIIDVAPETEASVNGGLGMRYIF